jgi:hypothetical protein
VERRYDEFMGGLKIMTEKNCGTNRDRKRLRDEGR